MAGLVPDTVPAWLEAQPDEQHLRLVQVVQDLALIHVLTLRTNRLIWELVGRSSPAEVAAALGVTLAEVVSAVEAHRRFLREAAG